ncbi:MAG: hypothetical protein AAFX87_10550 [Bacteroidota bacterium]
MNEEKIYTFLGAGDAALSMFIEVIASLEGKDFVLNIIKNIDVEQQHEYLIPGIKANILTDKEWQRNASDRILIGVNKAENKQRVYQYFKEHHGIQFKDYAALAHRNTSIAMTAKMEHGVILNPGVVLAPFSRLGNLTTINRNASVGHHTKIADFCTLHPGVNVAGHCEISSGVSIGMGANVVDGVSIGENSVIGAGSVVTKDIPPNVVAYGSPAKVVRSMKQNESN